MADLFTREEKLEIVRLLQSIEFDALSEQEFSDVKRAWTTFRETGSLKPLAIHRLIQLAKASKVRVGNATREQRVVRKFLLSDAQIAELRRILRRDIGLLSKPEQLLAKALLSEPTDTVKHTELLVSLFHQL